MYELLFFGLWSCLVFGFGWLCRGKRFWSRFKASGMPKEPVLGDYIQAYDELVQIRAVVLGNTDLVDPDTGDVVPE